MASFKPKEVVSILQKLGFVRKRQTGSHLILHHPGLRRTVSVPIHAREMKKGLVRGITNQANSTEGEFLRLK